MMLILNKVIPRNISLDLYNHCNEGQTKKRVIYVGEKGPHEVVG